MLALELIGGAVVLVGLAVVLSRALPVWDDEPEDAKDSGLPEGRLLLSDDVPRLRFRIGLRGYRMSDVDAALEALRLTLSEWESRQRDQAAKEPDTAATALRHGGGPLARRPTRPPASRKMPPPAEQPELAEQPAGAEDEALSELEASLQPPSDEPA